MNTGERNDILNEIIHFIKQIDNMSDVEIGPDTEIAGLNLSSVDFIRLIVNIEDKYEIIFDNRDLSGKNFITINDLIDRIISL